MRLRLDLFTEKQIELLMGNIEELYRFQQAFFQLLKLSINEQNPHDSLIGKCFLLYVRESDDPSRQFLGGGVFRKKNSRNIQIIVSIIHYHV